MAISETRARMIISLYREGYSIREIAEVFGLREGTVKVILGIRE